MNLPIEISNSLRIKYSYNWDEEAILSLGIKLTYPSSKLYEVNFPNLIDQVTKDQQIMQKIQLSWVGKIAAFRMQTLTKILFKINYAD